MGGRTSHYPQSLLFSLPPNGLVPSESSEGAICAAACGISRLTSPVPSVPSEIEANHRWKEMQAIVIVAAP